MIDELVCPVELFNNASHACLGDSSSAKDVCGVIRNLMSTSRGKGLEKPDRTAEVFRLVFVGHMAHLVGDLFKPGLCCLDETYHPREFLSNDGL